MEGPNTPERYAEYALRHAEAMLAVSPDLELFASGPYPKDEWALQSAAKTAVHVKNVSLHGYFGPTAHTGGNLHYTTPQETEETYNAIVNSAFKVKAHAYDMRGCLDATGQKLHISFDEWNQWFSWNRPSNVGDGIFTARVLHMFLNHSNELDMPYCCYFQPVGEGAILVDRQGSRLTANGQMFAMMKAHQDGRVCKVTDNDDLSTAATLKDGVLTVTLINADFSRDREFVFPLKGKVSGATLYSAEDVLPYSYFSKTPLPVTATRKEIRLTLPPHSAALIRLKVRE